MTAALDARLSRRRWRWLGWLRQTLAEAQPQAPIPGDERAVLDNALASIDEQLQILKATSPRVQTPTPETLARLTARLLKESDRR